MNKINPGYLILLNLNAKRLQRGAASSSPLHLPDFTDEDCRHWPQQSGSNACAEWNELFMTTN